MNIYIIRHGETDVNKKGFIQGWGDFPLNEYGRMLARETAAGMKAQGIRFDKCFSSPLKRAFETANLILEGSGNGSVPVRTDRRIMEINCGILEGHGIREENPDIDKSLFEKFYHDPLGMGTIPGGESIADVEKRTQEFLREISQKNYQNVLVSTHGCAMRCMTRFLSEHPENFWRGQIPVNCCVDIVEARGEWLRLKEEDVLYYDKSLAINRFDF